MILNRDNEAAKTSSSLSTVFISILCSEMSPHLHDTGIACNMLHGGIHDHSVR